MSMPNQSLALTVVEHERMEFLGNLLKQSSKRSGSTELVPRQMVKSHNHHDENLMQNN